MIPYPAYGPVSESSHRRLDAGPKSPSISE